jgi:hypothetical protein
MWFILAIPATKEAEIGRIVVQGQLRQKTNETPFSTNGTDVVVHILIPATWEA